jgi:hypothetical protein
LFRELIEFQVVEVFVQGAVADQLLVRSHCFNFAFVYKYQVIAMANGRDPVRQEDGRFPGQNSIQSIVEQVLGVVIEWYQGLLNDIDGRIAQYRPG